MIRVAVPIALALLGGCRQERFLEERVAPRGAERVVNLQTGTLFAGPEQHLPELRNPYEGNVHAIDEGGRLYKWMNCAGCHGAIGGGSIGPPLRDRDWIYGSSSGQIYHSIIEGRPNGMPAYRGLPDESLWKLIAYVRSLGGTPATDPSAMLSDPKKALRERRGAEEPHGAQ